MMARYAYFIKVEPNANNNKYYEMREEGGSIKVRYGRVDSTETTRSYPSYQWDHVYSTRISHGYTDKTELKATAAQGTFTNPFNGYAGQVFERLVNAAQATLDRNYEAGIKVTQAMLISAQNLIDKLLAADNIGYANELLVDLYMTIPRKMRNVRDHIAKDVTQLHQIIGEEQDLLDTMSASVETSAASQSTTYPFVLAEATPVDYGYVSTLWSGQHRGLVKVTRTNEPEMPTGVRLLWHGSGESNWYHILREGLRIRPATAYLTGAAFGNGIYFADYYQKSKNYCRGGRWIAICEVYLGNMLRYAWGDNEVGAMNWEKLRRKGDYHSVMGDAAQGRLLHNEYIVYQTNQQRIKYLMEVV